MPEQCGGLLHRMMIVTLVAPRASTEVDYCILTVGHGEESRKSTASFLPGLVRTREDTTGALQGKRRSRFSIPAITLSRISQLKGVCLHVVRRLRGVLASFPDHHTRPLIAVTVVLMSKPGVLLLRDNAVQFQPHPLLEHPYLVRPHSTVPLCNGLLWSWWFLQRRRRGVRSDLHTH